MSKYATPFIVLNLGSEMLFVVSQRLQAQNISPERSTHVLDEIASSLIHQQFITELLNQHNLINHSQMKDLIDDVAQSSIMRLDATSMDRLWDLITMVFKWQLTLSQDIFNVTTRHLYEIETFTTNPETQLQLHRVQNVIDNFNKILSRDEKIDLTEHVLMWLRDFTIRVSLLLRLGFQRPDGSFVLKNFDSKYARMLDNIGENIYAAAKQFNLNKAPNTSDNQQTEKHELNTMINQLLGQSNNDSCKENTQLFKLSLCEAYDDEDDSVLEDDEQKQIYSHIDVSSTNSFNVFNVKVNHESSNIHDDLLNIIDENVN